MGFALPEVFYRFAIPAAACAGNRRGKSGRIDDLGDFVVAKSGHVFDVRARPDGRPSKRQHLSGAGECGRPHGQTLNRKGFKLRVNFPAHFLQPNQYFTDCAANIAVARLYI